MSISEKEELNVLVKSLTRAAKDHFADMTPGAKTAFATMAWKAIIKKMSSAYTEEETAMLLKHALGLIHAKED